MGDIDRIQQGGTTEFNSNLQVIERLHYLTVQANAASMGTTLQDCQAWFDFLCCMHREISPLLNKTEVEDLETYRKKGKVPSGARRINTTLLMLEKEELHNYEQRLRYYIHKKGLGVRAREDAGAAIMR